MPKKKIIYYLSRGLTVLIVLFFAVFILEGFDPEFGWPDALSHFFTALIVLAITITAWKWPKIGGAIFIVLGLGLMVFLHPWWWNGLAIGGLPFLSGVLFLIEGYQK
jgi:hypothetical protein